MQTSIETLTKGLPEELYKFIWYCRNLKFDERPDYQYLRSLIADLMSKNGW